ncbi:YmfQ family protein [Pseudomonas sp. zfem002]|uniref:YmfQ family protein n=1 Tax=Pseudomonas sp. zfem002 TaxID=3078197 RepID=UPI002927AB81|nr:putative phage tail protein [Pseudomonas sp. zfem002]MDU9391531.1 putative phage tail protein [Pseudomonas sp. zfem002]
MVVRTAEDYYSHLRALLPPGPAWDREFHPEVDELLRAGAQELAREDARAFDLLSESNPETVRELVPGWERVMGLPDPCLGPSPGFDDRQLAVRRRLVAVGGQSRAYFIDLAFSLGYPEARIIEHRSPRFGRSRFGAARFGTWSAQFMWTLESGPRRRVGRRFGASYWGDRFGKDPITALECAVRQSAPAHAVEYIKYSENT